ncbi:MAG: hypothetical protein HFJ28_03675 [Clostridia bacterium]|nr:hypothetical protein [Clostridia bacterium]
MAVDSNSKPTRNFIIVKFHTYNEALAALIATKEKFPSRLSMSEDLSKIEENTVFFQSDSTPHPAIIVQEFLLSCPGAYPIDSGMYST